MQIGKYILYIIHIIVGTYDYFEKNVFNIKQKTLKKYHTTQLIWENKNCTLLQENNVSFDLLCFTFLTWIKLAIKKCLG
jgi:hypothetical protein